MDTVVVNSLLALIVAFGVAAALGPLLIPVLHRLKFEQNVRSNGPQSHLVKQDTPTMGGMMILLATALSTLIFAHRDYTLAILGLLMAVLFGLIGFLDDFIKIFKKRANGLSAWQKIAAQFVFAVLFAVVLYLHPAVGTTIWLDKLDLGIFFIPYAVFVIIATVNSVNLIDGADGLAASVTGVYALSGAFLMILFVLSFRSAAPEGEAAVRTATMLDRISGLAVFAAAAAGILLILLSRFLLSAFPRIIGIVMIVTAAATLLKTYNNSDVSLYSKVLYVLVIMIGIVIAVKPTGLINTMAFFIGVAFVVNGFSGLLLSREI